MNLIKIIQSAVNIITENFKIALQSAGRRGEGMKRRGGERKNGRMGEWESGRSYGLEWPARNLICLPMAFMIADETRFDYRLLS